MFCAARAHLPCRLRAHRPGDGEGDSGRGHWCVGAEPLLNLILEEQLGFALQQGLCGADLTRFAIDGRRRWRKVALRLLAECRTGNSRCQFAWPGFLFFFGPLLLRPQARAAARLRRIRARDGKKPSWIMRPSDTSSPPPPSPSPLPDSTVWTSTIKIQDERREKCWGVRLGRWNEQMGPILGSLCRCVYAVWVTVVVVLSGACKCAGVTFALLKNRFYFLQPCALIFGGIVSPPPRPPPRPPSSPPHLPLAAQLPTSHCFKHVRVSSEMAQIGRAFLSVCSGLECAQRALRRHIV